MSRIPGLSRASLAILCLALAACQKVSPPPTTQAPEAALTAAKPLQYKTATQPAIRHRGNLDAIFKAHRGEAVAKMRAPKPSRRQLLQVGSGLSVSTLAGPTEPHYDEGSDVGEMYFGTSDGQGAAARFKRPWGMAVDQAGNVFVADSENHRIRKITPDGLVSTLAGSRRGHVEGTGSGAQFDTPFDVAVDETGNVFVADLGNNRIRKVTPQGVVTTVVGSGPVDWYNPGSADGPALEAKLFKPAGLARDATGNLYITELGNHVVRKLGTDGQVVTVAGGTDGAFDEEGVPLGGFAEGTGTAARFNNPIDVAVDAAGNLFVADYENFRIRKITPQQVVSTLAGSGEFGYLDGPGATAQFSNLGGIAIDACGTVYVPDEKHERIRQVLANGQVSTLAGTGEFGFNDGPALSAQFASPEGIALGLDGSLYVSEYWGNRVRKLNLPVASCGGAALTGAEPNAFSPNGDGVKDGYALTVTSNGAWTIQVDGHPGAIDTGPGPQSGNKTLAWDGKVNGIILPDGKYTLRLKTGAEEKTAEVVIDRIAPTFEFFIDNQLVRGSNGKLIGAVAPEFKLDLKDTLAGFADKEHVELAMPRRRDGITPTVFQDSVTFQQNGTNASYKYSVPLKLQHLLLPGDQWVDVKVRDAAGNEAKRRVSFAVGARDLFSGIGGPSAYQLMQTTDAGTRPYPLPAKYNGYAVERIPAPTFAPPKPGQPLRPNYFVYLVRANAIAGAVTIVFFDDEIKDAIEFFKTKSYIVHTEFGDINLPLSVLHKAESKHPEVKENYMADALRCIREPTRFNGQFELWQDPTPIASISASFLLVCKIDNTVFRMPISKELGADFFSVKTMYGYRHKPRGALPLPTLKSQWSGVAIDVARFMRKEFIRTKWQLDNPSPEFPKHLIGEITDDTIKPYRVIHEVRADANPEREIIRK